MNTGVYPLVGLFVVLSLTSCSSQKQRTPSETLIAYYDAVDRGDTTAFLTLSTEERAMTLRQSMQRYLTMFSGKGHKPQVKSEVITPEREAHVRYMERGDSVECVLVEIDGEWKVSYCRGIPGAM